MNRRTCSYIGLIGLTSCLIYLLLYILFVSEIIKPPAQSYKDPPKDWNRSNLKGTWATTYGGSSNLINGTLDTIIIRDDGTFKQIYKERRTNYAFETPWNQWWLEILPNGITRIHLMGGRYYVAGTRIGELDGKSQWGDGSSPEEFYDPYANENVEMVNQLILDVRMNASGDFILYQMWMTSDQGFPLFGDEYMLHRKTSDIPSS